MSAYFSPLIVTFLLVLFSVPLAGTLAWRWGVLDHPGPRKIHLRPMPRLGGLALYGASALSIVFFLHGEARAEGLRILVAGTLMATVGVLDDAGKIHHQVKLRIGIPLAALVLILSGIHVTCFAMPLLNDGLTMLWVMGIVSAFNLLDNMDGLCASVAAIAAAFFLVFALMTGQYLVGTLAAVVAGGALGFLCHNVFPARIFMGDGGALFIGCMLAALGLQLRFTHGATHLDWMLPLFILGVPILDTSLVTISRLRRGLVPFASPGKDHISHRLANRGLGQRAVVLVHQVLGVGFGLLAVWLSHLSVSSTYLLGAAVLGAGLVGLAALERLPCDHQAGCPIRFRLRRSMSPRATLTIQSDRETIPE